MNRRIFWIIFIVGVALRIFWINVPALWYDENFTLLVARLPLDRAFDAIKGDVHPPLWYLIEWCLFHIAPNLPAWFIRVPALLFSIASLPMFVIVMRKLTIPSTVQTAAFVMMAVMPFQLWYAQEGRMYAMLEFLVLLMLSAALGQSYLFMFVGSLALFYTQNYGAFYVGAIAIVVMAREIEEKLSHIKNGERLFGEMNQNAKVRILSRFPKFNASMNMMMGAGVLWLPWLTVVMGQMNSIEGRYWIMDKSFAGILIIVYKLFLTASVPSAFFFASYVVTFAAWIFGMIAFVRSHHPQRLTIAIMAFLPLLIAWVASVVWQPVLLFRPLIGISPFLYIITAWSFSDATIENRSNRVQAIHPGIARQAE